MFSRKVNPGKTIHLMLAAAALMLCSACKIPNDIPFPTLEGSFTEFVVEGMCSEDGSGSGKAEIDKTTRTVKAYVGDTVDITRLKLGKVSVTNNAKIEPELVEGGIYDFSNPMAVTLHTHQDYLWNIEVKQVIKREIEMENQVGDAIIDARTRSAIVYLSTTQDLANVKVNKFTLGGPHGQVYPDPTEGRSFDFSKGKATFFVKNYWTEYSVEWTLFIYTKEAPVEVTAEAFARTVNATVSGTRPGSETVTVSYREAGDNEWTVLPASAVSASGNRYSAEVTGLKPEGTYEYKASAGNSTSSVGRFTTTAALQLENASFDHWHLEGERLWNPWEQGGNSFWDTGNKGATTVGESNSRPSDDSSTGSGKSALLQSKYIVIKFAAGNIFTGKYVKTDGTNGVLDFGRPFSAFPSKLTFDFRYTGATINRCGSSEYEKLKGQPDECMVYIALTDWDQPFQVRTKPSDQNLFSKDDPKVIAYAEMVRSKNQADWATATLELEYKTRTRTPKYILVVCSSSRYGDFFTGGEGSTLQVDNFNLIYE